MNLRKELPLLFIVSLPFMYLGYIYASLPETIPTHWNGDGIIDAWGPKSSLWILPFLLPVLIYVLMSIVPRVDPKGQIKQMGAKFYQLKFILTLFMSALALYLIYATQMQSLGSLKIIFLLLGVLFAALGNYLPSVKPNYFIGMRTPWTLESEVVWKKTHRLAGKLWVIGGLAIICLAVLLDTANLLSIFLTITAVITIIPLVYSYIWFQKEKKS